MHAASHDWNKMIKFEKPKLCFCIRVISYQVWFLGKDDIFALGERKYYFLILKLFIVIGLGGVNIVIIFIYNPEKTV